MLFFTSKAVPHGINKEETSDEPKLRGILQSTQPAVFKRIKVKKKNQGHGRKGMTRRLSQPERDCRDPVTKCNS